MTTPEAISQDYADVLYFGEDARLARATSLTVQAGGLSIRRYQSVGQLLNLLRTADEPPLCLILEIGRIHGQEFALYDELQRIPSFQCIPIVLVGADSASVSALRAHGALYGIPAHAAPEEISAMIHAVIAQHKRSLGVIDLGDLRLDPRSRTAFHSNRPVARLTPGHFTALQVLVKNSPGTVADLQLYRAFIERHAYNTLDPELSIHVTLKNYVSRLRHELGPTIGGRISRAREEGYVYLQPSERYISNRLTSPSGPAI